MILMTKSTGSQNISLRTRVVGTHENLGGWKVWTPPIVWSEFVLHDLNYGVKPNFQGSKSGLTELTRGRGRGRPLFPPSGIPYKICKTMA